MKKKMNIGITALSQISRVYEQLNCYHLGYVMGPEVNAGGRVGKQIWFKNLRN